jgi:hypothetical protein
VTAATQELLAEKARERLLAARPGLDLPDSPAELAALLAGRWEPEDAGQDSAGQDGVHSVVAVVRRVDTVSWLRGTCAFAFGMAPERAAAWRRSFTHTVFLAGNPRNLRDRVAFDHVAEDASLAWHGPAEPRASVGLRRLLKVVSGAAPFPVRPPQRVDVPAGAARRRPVHRDLYVATAGVSFGQALVHLNHLVAEAVLDDLVGPGDRLTLRRVPRLPGVPTPFAALRVDADPAHPDRLRAFAGLTQETTDVRPHSS